MPTPLCRTKATHMTAKQQMITNWSTKCASLYCAFMSYMVVHVHGNVPDLHLHYRENQLLMRRNCTWHLFVMKGSANICYLTQLRFPWKYSAISAHPNIHFYRHRMSLKQIWHDKNLIIEINATHLEINLIFSWTIYGLGQLSVVNTFRARFPGHVIWLGSLISIRGI